MATRNKQDVLHPAEQEIDDFARTVDCPNCGRKAGRRCVGEPKADGQRQALYSSHLGRLLKARGGAK